MGEESVAVFRDTLATVERVSQKLHSMVNHAGYIKQRHAVDEFSRFIGFVINFGISVF